MFFIKPLRVRIYGNIKRKNYNIFEIYKFLSKMQPLGCWKRWRIERIMICMLNYKSATFDTIQSYLIGEQLRRRQQQQQQWQ